MTKKEKFIEKSIKKFGSKFDYSKVEYVDSVTPVTIICPIHGEFTITPVSHLRNNGCQKCGNDIKKQKMSLKPEDFFKRAKKIHNNKYDYSKSVYINMNTEIIIVCPEHGEFTQTPLAHLFGKNGCPKCAGKNKTLEELIEDAKKVHGDKYDYSMVIKQKRKKDKVTIICPIHGPFEQSLTKHINKKQGCRKCSNTYNYTNSEWIQKVKIIHNNKYEYNDVEYKNNKENVIITCPIHGPFEQTPINHIHGHGCPKCNRTISKAEETITKFINSLKYNTIRGRNIVGNTELDIYIPEKRIAIEYNGLRWHSEQFIENKNYHLDKTNKCKENNIRLIHIFEDEWLNNPEIVMSRISNILGDTVNKIYARKCTIKEITYKDSVIFLTKNHIQGNCNSSIRLGLFYNDELVSVMTFGKQRKCVNNTNKNGYELLRFCNKLDTTIIGGASKLFNFFIEKYNPSNIISYADRRWSEGKLYETLGFKLYNISKPNYFYVIRDKRIHRYSMRKDVLISKYNCPPEMSEHDFCLSKGWYRIYDCGCLCYEWKK